MTQKTYMLKWQICIISLWVSRVVLPSGCQPLWISQDASVHISGCSREYKLGGLHKASYHPIDYPRNLHRRATGFCKAIRESKSQHASSLQASAWNIFTDVPLIKENPKPELLWEGTDQVCGYRAAYITGSLTTAIYHNTLFHISLIKMSKSSTMHMSLVIFPLQLLGVHTLGLQHVI